MSDDLSPSDSFNTLNDFAHDLRAPLSAAKSFIELMETAGDLTAEQVAFSNKALKALSRAQTAIDELLDYTRIMNAEHIDMQNCDMLEAIDDTLDMLMPDVRRRRIQIEVDIRPPLNFVFAQERMLGHLMQNLISNAIKYNVDNGRVQISAEDLGDFIQFHVRDTGIGIPQEAQDFVFERFFRVKQSRDRRIEGTGLGLAITKTIVEKHGGQITLKSTEGEGTTFSFTLPHASSSSSDYGRERTDDLDDRMQESRESHDDIDTGMY